MSDKHKNLSLVCGVNIEAADTSGDMPSLPKFSMISYTGGEMKIDGWRYPVVVDLAGIDIPSQNRPIRFQHDSTKGVGHTDSIKVDGGKLIATGVISRDTEWAKDVTNSSKNGFPWQASIGARSDRVEFVSDKQMSEANGIKFSGPINDRKKVNAGRD